MSKLSRYAQPASAPGWLLCVLLLSSGCGRIGVELLSFDTGGSGPGDADSGSDEMDSGTADEDADTDAALGDADADADAAASGDAAADGGIIDGDAGETAVVCSPKSATDTTCDGVDDNCNGAIDEGYVAISGCGVGYCQTNAVGSRCVAGVEMACQPAAPLSSTDTTPDDIDDDCDGLIDEDTCKPRTETFGPGQHTLLRGTCQTITVKLWGGAGASGDSSGGYWGLAITGGRGGAGGYAQGVLSVTGSSVVQLYVGRGGQGCDAPGTNPNAAYNGGAGGANSAQAGSPGANGTQAGGSGGTTSALGGGGRGGNGFFGGGGGGAGTNAGYARFGRGGGGGAATVAMVVNGTSIIAGGGGGGGGAGSDFTTMGHAGANGGSGCGANGANADEGGGGGGGGVCQGGSDMRQSTARTPYDPENLLLGNEATGGINTTDCSPGGDGFAVVTFAP